VKWIVGLDLRPSSQGALHFATWLRGLSSAERLEAVHVIEGAGGENPESLEAPARAATERVLDREQARSKFGDVAVVRGSDPHAAILDAFGDRGGDALVVGREGAARASASDRLGEVSRRLLRALPGPVVVTRPDLHGRDLGGGPILVSSDLSPDSAAALSFARTVGDAIAREVVVGHVVRHLDHRAVYSPDQDWHTHAREQEQQARARLDDWVRSQGVEARTIIDEGIATRRILDMAHVENACLIVCGARAHGEMFLSGTGTDLASNSRIPVAVVPSNYRPPA
jgi:nucleotide-binding universal stress UspA family protein